MDQDVVSPVPIGEIPEYVEQVLAIVEQIPTGRVLSYGDVAELLGSGGPRQVGAVMAVWGSAVPWWRVIRADGSLPADLWARALPHYRRERTALRSSGTAVDMRRGRWDGPEGIVPGV